MSLRGVKFQFRAGECVLCFEPDATKAKVLYDAKILDLSVTHDKSGKRRPAYLIHFLRWNSSWDRVVPESYLLKNSDDNRALMRKLALVSQKIKRNKSRMKKIDCVLKHHFQKLADPNEPVESDEDDVSTKEDGEGLTDSSSNITDSDSDASAEEENESDKAASDVDDCGRSTDQESEDETSQPPEPVTLEIPQALKKILQRDHHTVCFSNNLLRLPATVNVISILEGFVKFCSVSPATMLSDKQARSTRSQDENAVLAETNVNLSKEVVDGLRVIFDFTLPLILLYDCERDQYNSLTHSHLRKQQGKSPTKSRSSRCGSPRVSAEYQAVKSEEETEVIFKTDSVGKSQKSISPRQRRQSKATETANVSVATTEQQLTPKRLRRYSKDLSRIKDRVGIISESTVSSLPVYKSVYGSPISSRASSPDRLTTHKLTCIDQKQFETTSQIFNWKLVPEELYYTVPAPPSLIYGAQHLLRLFVRLPGILDQMLIPKRKLTLLVRHLELFIQYLFEHRDEFFPESSYCDTI